MILAEKIVRLRKQNGWSQEELAEKLKVSRQSVSKWESSNSIPDLNKILMLAEVFGVSTDLLLKDDNEAIESNQTTNDSSVKQISLEQAHKYVESKLEASAITTKGVMLSVCSVVPLFFFLAMADTGRLNGDVAAAMGIVGILVMVAWAVSFFIKTDKYKNDLSVIDDEEFELAYGVHSVFQDKLEKFRESYNKRLSIGIFLFIVSFVPLMLGSMFLSGEGLTLILLIVLMLIVASGIYVVSPVSAKYEAYNNILRENFKNTEKAKREKRAGKLAAFYWPLLTAIFLGWSLWTMDWGNTWIVWPVGAVVYVALLGLMELFEKE